jgi:hypothetical protein
MLGTRVAATTIGRWELRGNAIRWSYDAPERANREDEVNPIVLKARDRFILRELDGSEAAFFLKGAVDPEAPPDLPVGVGAGWVMKDELGEFTIRVTARETVGTHDCYRVDWLQGASEYQSEYWFMDSEGVRVAGRRVLGVRLEFQKPYLLVKRALKQGDTWDASLTVQGKEMKASISVGRPGEVLTPTGRFRAVPVTLESDELHYARWYAKDVGLVREDVFVGGYLHNTKTLQRRLE